MLEMATNNFKKFWIGGISIFVLLVLLNPFLITNVSPAGIIDHQIAGNADKVDAIQHAWLASGAISWAKIGMIGDLLFIGVYAFGAFCGGILLGHDGRKVVRRLGSLIIVSAILFCFTDYLETIAQVIQLFMMSGNDSLASIAAAVNPFKTAAFLITLIGLLGVIIWDKIRAKL